MAQESEKYAVRLFTAGESVEDALAARRWGIVRADSGASIEEAVALYKLATA